MAGVGFRIVLVALGGIALVALAMPELIVIGLFLGILPGLVLSIAPAAFLYLTGFAVIRAVLPIRRGPIRNIGAAALTLAAGCLAALPMALAGKAEYLLAVRSDVTPSQPVALSGVVRLERSETPVVRDAEGNDVSACDALCAALLLTPGVTAVTLAGNHYDAAVAPLTYRLVAKTATGKPTLAPLQPEQILDQLPRSEPAPGRWQDAADQQKLRRDAVVADWALRLATRQSLIAATPVGAPDTVVTITEARGKSRHAIDVRRVEIAAHGRIVFRRQSVLAEPVALPLLPLPEDAGAMSMQWGLMRSVLRTGPRGDEFAPVAALFAQTDLARPVAPSGGVTQMRAAIVAAVDNPALRRGDPAFTLVGRWLDTTDYGKLAQDDVPLIARLIADPRVTGLARLSQGLSKDVPMTWRGPMVARLLDPTTPDELRHQFDQLLGTMPPGTFRTPTALELRYFADQALRMKHPSLVGRLSDQGAAGVPMLMNILRADVHVEPWSTRNWEMQRIGEALIRLGPDAAAALPLVESLYDANGEAPMVNEWREGVAWRVAMVRMGKPIADLRFYKSWSPQEVASGRADVMAGLERFKRDGRIDF